MPGQVRLTIDGREAARAHTSTSNLPTDYVDLSCWFDSLRESTPVPDRRQPG
jgi:hypothetical protein